MTDPMAHLGEDVPPRLGPDALVILELIRDTMLSPKPISRGQAALSILVVNVPLVFCQLVETDASPEETDRAIDGAIRVSIRIADKLLSKLEDEA